MAPSSIGSSDQRYEGHASDVRALAGDGGGIAGEAVGAGDDACEDAWATLASVLIGVVKSGGAATEDITMRLEGGNLRQASVPW